MYGDDYVIVFKQLVQKQFFRQLKSMLSVVQNWDGQNSIKVNPAKAEVMIFALGDAMPLSANYWYSCR